MARIAVEFMVTLELDVPDELAARMTKDDLAETADIAAHHRGAGPCRLVVGNEFAGTCQFSMRPLRDGLVPDDITLGVFGVTEFPELLDAGPEPMIVADR